MVIWENALRLPILRVDYNYSVLHEEFAKRKLDVALVQDADDPAGVDYMIYASARDDDDLSVYQNVRLIQSLWAGPDKLLQNPTLTQPLARMVDPG